MVEVNLLLQDPTKVIGTRDKAVAGLLNKDYEYHNFLTMWEQGIAATQCAPRLTQDGAANDRMEVHVGERSPICITRLWNFVMRMTKNTDVIVC